MPRLGDLQGKSLIINGTPVSGGSEQQKPLVTIPDPINAPAIGVGPASLQDTQELRASVVELINALKTLGLIRTS